MQIPSEFFRWQWVWFRDSYGSGNSRVVGKSVSVLLTRLNESNPPVPEKMTQIVCSSSPIHFVVIE